MSVIKKKVKLVTLDTWINPEGISKIIFIPIIKKYGYHITCGTKEEWVVYTPEGGKINLNHNCRQFKGMPSL